MNRSVLITGITGFVGSNLARRFWKDNWDVIALVRPTSNVKVLGDCLGKIKMIVFDGNIGSLSEIMVTLRPQVVIHLASYFVAEHQTEDVEKLLQSNLIFGAFLLEAMSKANVRRIVVAGTAWQNFHDETYNPVCLYAATKQAFEGLLKYYTEVQGFAAISLRLFDTYGPFDPRDKVISLLKRAALTGMKLEMSEGLQEMNLVYIDDVVEAFWQASEQVILASPGSFEVYGVYSNEYVTLRDVVRIFEEVTGCPLRVEWGKRPYRKREVMKVPRNLKRVPGWEPRVSLREGLRRTFLEGR